MPNSSLFGRRVHIAGSIASDPKIAAVEDVAKARDLVVALVKKLMRCGANFVVPVDAEPVRAADDEPICFDWLIWTTIKDNLSLRPANASGILAVAVQHHKSEDQIPSEYTGLWDELRSSSWVTVENAAHWNMNSKRMEAQARLGDILIALGGTEGVLYLANLYNDAGKPVVPLNLKICPESSGARKLYSYGLTSTHTHRLFRVSDDGDPHDWINRIQFPARQNVHDRVEVLVDLLENLERPLAFAIRLLNPGVEEFKDVDSFFDTVVQPVIEDELGYRLVVVDGVQAFEEARIDQDIFAKLHRSRVVIADVTGSRPNCFLEMGYALGRNLPTMVMAREGTKLPFDITTFAGLLWKTDGTGKERRREFKEHWHAIRNRPSLVPAEPLIS